MTHGSQFGQGALPVRDRAVKPYVEARARADSDIVLKDVADICDLCPEAAFNLSTIMHQSGSNGAARTLLRQYIQF